MGYSVSWKPGGVIAEGYKDALVHLKTLAEYLGWTTLRWTNSAELEWIVQAPGLSLQDPVHIGIATYSSSADGVFNWKIGVFSGYDPGATFSTQPDAIIKALPLSAGPTHYAFSLNNQRMVGALVVGDYCQPLYAGKFLANEFYTPHRFPIIDPATYHTPLCVGATLESPRLVNTEGPQAITSGTAYGTPFKGNRPNLSVRDALGRVVNPTCWPWGCVPDTTYIRRTGTGALEEVSVSFYDSGRDLNNTVQMLPAILESPDRVLGELDGVFYLPKYGHKFKDEVMVGSGRYLILKDLNNAADTNVAIKLE